MKTPSIRDAGLVVGRRGSPSRPSRASPRTASVLGRWPMATKTPSTGSPLSRRWRCRAGARRSTASSPRISSTVDVPVDLDLRVALGARLHDLAGPELVAAVERGGPSRRSGSGRAPPPGPSRRRRRRRSPCPGRRSRRRWRRRDTPRPRSRSSDGRPSQMAEAPVATITAWARYSTPAAHDPERARREVDPVRLHVDDPASRSARPAPGSGPSARGPGSRPGSPGSSRRRS